MPDERNALDFELDGSILARTKISAKAPATSEA